MVRHGEFDALAPDLFGPVWEYLDAMDG